MRCSKLKYLILGKAMLMTYESAYEQTRIRCIGYSRDRLMGCRKTMGLCQKMSIWPCQQVEPYPVILMDPLCYSGERTYLPLPVTPAKSSPEGFILRAEICGGEKRENSNLDNSHSTSCSWFGEVKKPTSNTHIKKTSLTRNLTA